MTSLARDGREHVFAFTVPCETTASTTIGSTCAVSTSADAIQSGTVREKARTIWQLGAVELFGGGPDVKVSRLRFGAGTEF